MSQHLATSVAELQVAVVCLALVGQAALTNNSPGGVGSSQRLGEFTWSLLLFASHTS